VLSVVCRSVPPSEIVPARRLVVLAVMNDPYVVDEYEKDCSRDQLFAVVVPKAREMLLDDICRGYVEDVILPRYAMFQSDDDAVSVLYEAFQLVVEADRGML
jgi:hypothetical protein